MNQDGQNTAAPAAKPKSRGPRKGAAAKTELEILEDISKKLDRVVAVLAAQGKERGRQIEILSAAGCDSAFVGTIVGLTASAVRVFQTRQRQKVGESNRAAAATSTAEE